MSWMQDALFLDKTGGGYFNNTGEDASVLLRVKEDHDGVLQHFLFLKSFLGIDKGSHFIDFRSVIPWVRFDPLRCFVFLLLMNIFRGGSFWEIRGCGVNIVGMSTLISP